MPAVARTWEFLSQCDGAPRRRSIGAAVLSATLEIAPLPARLSADCQREIATRLQLDIGDVEPLSLARARTRWPDYRRWVQAANDWARTLAPGLGEVLAASDIALMACRGAPCHHDGERYGDAAFCNLFLSDDRGLDVLFPCTGQRIALVRGTAMVFDTCQPHAVVARGRDAFDAADFLPGEDWNQLFLTWELPIEAPPVATALGIVFDPP